MNYYTLFSGTGVGKTELTSIDNALFNSRIANYNLVKISSILPPCVTFKKEIELSEGSILNTAQSSITACAGSKAVSAAVGVAVPEDSAKVGVIMEFSGCCSVKESEETVKEMLIEAMQIRESKIKEFKIASAEITPDGDGYYTAVAGISLW